MFKETQERKVDLKEDDPSMVELMIKFFYTFGYDNPPAQSDISLLGLHARVYTIADKYEVLVLKSLALAKFKSGLYTSYKDGKVMVEATRALTACRPLPCCDTTLHDLMTEAWYHGGKDIFASGDEADISSMFEEVVWLPVAVAKHTLKDMNSDSLRGRCTDGCKKVSEVDIWSVMTGIVVRCKYCQAVLGDDEETQIFKLCYFGMKKSIWDEPAK